MIGYIPLPTNTREKFDLFGAEIPSFALYAATANISVPLVLTLVVWIGYHVEGVRAKGVIGYLKSWVPAGVEGAAAVPIFVIEVISHFVRIISLSVRLFANILAGHLLILFMAGGLVVLLGHRGARLLTLPWPWPSSSSKWAWWPPCRPSSSPLSPRSISAARSPRSTKRSDTWTSTPSAILAQAAAIRATAKGLRAIALGVGAGLGTIGPGVGVGYIFGKVIESVTRQPEMRDEITSIQWLGFALTEAIVFYAFIFGLIAFFLSA